jgi:Lipocalin-like domain
VFGSNPIGQFIFTANGRFSFQVAAEIPKFASGDYRKTTPEENRAVVQGAMAYFGTFTATDAEKTIALHIERSSIPNLNGTDGKRVVTAITADEMNWTNPAPLGGGSISCANKRAK